MKPVTTEAPAIAQGEKTTKHVIFEAPAAEQAEREQKTPPEAAAFNDEAILDLAKRRLAAKRGLINQALDFLLITFMVFLIVNLSYYDGGLLGFCFIVFWGARLLFRVFKFAKPSFRDGIAAYLQKRREQQLEFEYNKLKRMNPEYVVGELNK